MPTVGTVVTKSMRPGFLSPVLLTAAAFCYLSFPLLAASESDFHGEVLRGKDLWEIPGLAAAVVKGDSIEYEHALGVASVDSGVPVDLNTPFAIASTTKAMVAAAVLLLVDEDRLSLNDPAIKHLPGLHLQGGELTQQVTIRDLLAHRTGLPPTNFWRFPFGMPLDEQIARLRFVTPTASARSRFVYQNTMYQVVGLIVERVTGEPLDQFLRRRLWQPIGMRSTFASRQQIPDDREHAWPHKKIDGRMTRVEWNRDGGLTDAAGSVWSSIHDMALWAQFLLRGGVTAGGERLLTESSVALMFEPQQIISAEDYYPTGTLTQPNWRTYSLGWYQQDFQGRKIDFHTGSLLGLVAMIGLDREAGIGVVVLGNRHHAEMRHAFLWHVMDQRPAESRVDWSQEVHRLYQTLDQQTIAYRERMLAARLSDTVPTLRWKSYAGDYRSEMLGQVRVDTVQDGLTMTAGVLALPLEHWHQDSFLYERAEYGVLGIVSFDIGIGGQVDGLTAFGSDFQRIDRKLAEEQ